MYKFTKFFYSRDGKLEVDNREYGMSQEGLNEIGDARPHLGGATHIYVKTKGGPSNKINFSTKDDAIVEVVEEKAHGWAEYGLRHSSAFNPSKGEEGWWDVHVEGAPSEVVDGLGLPYSWHISTFIVFEWKEDEVVDPEVPEDGPDIPEPEEPEGEGPIAVTISLIRNGKNLGTYKGVVNKQ